MAEGPAITLGGSAGLAMTYMGEFKDAKGMTTHESQMTFNHFVKIGLAGKGITDGGLTFGADVRINTNKVDDADVFIGGELWTLTVGTPDRASDLGFGIGDVGWDGNLGVDDVAENIGKSTGDAQARFDLTLGTTTLAISVAQSEATPYKAAVPAKYLDIPAQTVSVPAQTITVKGGTFTVAGIAVTLPDTGTVTLHNGEGIPVAGTNVVLPDYTGTIAGGGTVTLPALPGTYGINGVAGYRATAADPDALSIFQGYVTGKGEDDTPYYSAIDFRSHLSPGRYSSTAGESVEGFSGSGINGAPATSVGDQVFWIATTRTPSDGEIIGSTIGDPLPLTGLQKESDGSWTAPDNWNGGTDSDTDRDALDPDNALHKIAIDAAEEYIKYFDLGAIKAIGGSDAEDGPQNADDFDDAGRTILSERAGLRKFLGRGDDNQVTTIIAATPSRTGTLDGDASVTVTADGDVQVTDGTVTIDGVAYTLEAGDATVTEGTVTVADQEIEVAKQDITIAARKVVLEKAVAAVMAQSQKTHWGVGVKSELGPVTLGLGADSNDALMFSVGGSMDSFGGSVFYGRRNMDEGEDMTSLGAEGTFSAGAGTNVNLVYAQAETGNVKADGFGMGVTHVLGGGAKVQAGLARVEDRDKFSVGVLMAF